MVLLALNGASAPGLVNFAIGNQFADLLILDVVVHDPVTGIAVAVVPSIPPWLAGLRLYAHAALMDITTFALTPSDAWFTDYQEALRHVGPLHLDLAAEIRRSFTPAEPSPGGSTTSGARLGACTARGNRLPTALLDHRTRPHPVADHLPRLLWSCVGVVDPNSGDGVRDRLPPSDLMVIQRLPGPVPGSRHPGFIAEKRQPTGPQSRIGPLSRTSTAPAALSCAAYLRA